jgi:hypothetical protein
LKAGDVNALIADLKTSAESYVRVGTSGKIVCAITAFMRYAGQGWEIPVPLPNKPYGYDAVCKLKDWFQTSYQRFFGRAIDGLDGLEIEVVTWSVKATDERPVAAKYQLTGGKRTIQPSVARAVRSRGGPERASCAEVRKIAAHHRFWPKQLMAVCSLLLQSGPEGSSSIFHTARRCRTSVFMTQRREVVSIREGLSSPEAQRLIDERPSLSALSKDITAAIVLLECAEAKLFNLLPTEETMERGEHG